MIRCLLSISQCLISLVLMLAICGATGRDKQTDQFFEDKETGWSAHYPTSWKVIPEAKAKKRDGKKTTDTAAEKAKLLNTRLLWIRHGEINSFTSVKSVFNSFDAEGYYNYTYTLQDSLIKFQQNAGVKSSGKHGSMMIDGLEFKTFEFTIYEQDGKAIREHSLSCTRFIGGKNALTLNLFYNNESDRSIMMGILTSSKLVIRD